jgi:N-acetylglucosaminyl-diphospho-decaprenol L-rhamnosyltransferase
MRTGCPVAAKRWAGLDESGTGSRTERDAIAGSVHIVIVNWNTGPYLRECLESIVLADRPDVSIARVTVVDNASSDDSASGLEDLLLPLELIRNRRNVGFAAACNQGAAGSTADYLLFLNPDTRLFEDTLAAVTRFMDGERSRGIGICGAQVLDGGGAPTISCSRFPTLRVLFGKMTGLHRVLPQVFPAHHLAPAEIEESRRVDQVIGAFFLVRRELFTRLGGFDARYFIYFEDVDFALRAHREGALTYFLREATVLHLENVSSNQVHDVRLHHSLRSRWLYAREHWPRRQAHVLVFLTLTVELIGRFATAALRRSPSDMSATARAYRRFAADLLRAT